MREKKNKWSLALDKLFDALETDVRRLSPDEKAQTYETLTSAFNEKLTDMKRHQSEIEYGQHVEGLYGINAGETSRYYGGRPKWTF